MQQTKGYNSTVMLDGWEPIDEGNAHRLMELVTQNSKESSRVNQPLKTVQAKW